MWEMFRPSAWATTWPLAGLGPKSAGPACWVFSIFPHFWGKMGKMAQKTTHGEFSRSWLTRVEVGFWEICLHFLSLWGGSRRRDQKFSRKFLRKIFDRGSAISGTGLRQRDFAKKLVKNPRLKSTKLRARKKLKRLTGTSIFTFIYLSLCSQHTINMCKICPQKTPFKLFKNLEWLAFSDRF